MKSSGLFGLTKSYIKKIDKILTYLYLYCILLAPTKG